MPRTVTCLSTNRSDPRIFMAWAYALAGGAVGVVVALALYAASGT